MSGNKVICDNNKTYYFNKPIDVRTLTQGHLDGNWANFVNFHIYVNINDEFTDWRTEWSSGKFIIENMNFGKEDSWLELPEGWETPLITTGSPMVIRNINTRYPYVLATVERYIDIMTCENWSANFNWDLYSGFAINLDAISCLNSAGVYTRCNDASCVIEAGDGWKISQCQEFHSKNARPEYYMMHITSRQPILVESCIQCNFDISQYSKATFLNCHWESHSTVTFTSNYMVWALFMNCYFYQNYVINDAPSTTYKNCHFRSGVEATDSTVPFAYSTGNKFLFDMQCTFEDCVFSNNSRITTSHLLANKNMPKKTYNYQVIDYRDVSVDGLHYIDLSQYPNRAHFATLGTYTYDVYWKLTSLETIAAEHYVWTYNVTNAKTCLWNDFQFANGGSSFVIVRTNPNGKMEYTKYYGDPNAFEKAIDYSAIKFKDFGNYAIFSVVEHDEHITEIEPWIAIDAKPEISINANLYEANGVLVTSDGSVFEHSKYKKYGYIQPATVAMLGNKLDKDGKLQSLMLTEKTDWAGENGYRCFASKELTSYHNGRGVFLVSSRHNGTGVLSFAYGCNSGTVNANTVYANITYVGTNTSPENIDKDNAWQAWFNPANNTMYFFCHCYEYDHIYLTDVAEKGHSKLPLLDSPIWMTTIDSATYGAKVCGLDIIRKIVVDNNLSDSSINPVENRVVTAAIKNVEDKIVQSDWNQSDETASDYIKNRTHYEGITKIIHFESEFIVEDIRNNTGTVYFDFSNVPYEFNKTVYIELDGIEYVSFFDSDMEACNAIYIPVRDVEDTYSPNYRELPCIHLELGYITFHNRYPEEAPLFDGEPHTLKIYDKQTVVKKIDSKFLHTPDWSQNDETAADYIKNRTHYEIDKREIILPETTLNFNKAGSSGMQKIDRRIDLIENETYIVTWDNTEYLCVSHSYSGEAIGNNAGIAEGTASEGFNPDAPFFIWSSGLTMSYETGEHTFKIEKPVKEIHKIDKKFLPDDVGVTPDWNQNDETAPDYIKNRTHYENREKLIHIPETVGTVENGAIDFDYSLLPWELGHKLFIVFDGIEYETICKENSDACDEYGFSVNNSSYVSFWDHGGILAVGSSYLKNGDTHTYEIYEYTGTIKQLDEKFIPDNLKAGRIVTGIEY